MDSFADRLNQQLDSCYPDVSQRLNSLGEVPEITGLAVLKLLATQACQSQHIGNIQAARKALRAVPGPYLSRKLQLAIDEALNLQDEWEYRRLLELLRELNSDLLPRYVSQGLFSDNVEIREAAQDFQSDS